MSAGQVKGEETREDNVFMAKLAEQAERYDGTFTTLFTHFYQKWSHS